MLLLLSIQSAKVGFGQTPGVEATSLKDVFVQAATAGALKDSCTSLEVQVEIVFSGNVQLVLPKRVKQLNEIISHCGFKSSHVWTKGNSELSVLEEETRYWLQLEPGAADKILSRYKMGDKLIISGRVLTWHTNPASSFLIVEKISPLQ
jgi:hypothetical protein